MLHSLHALSTPEKFPGPLFYEADQSLRQGDEEVPHYCNGRLHRHVFPWKNPENTLDHLRGQEMYWCYMCLNASTRRVLQKNQHPSEN